MRRKDVCGYLRSLLPARRRAAAAGGPSGTGAAQTRTERKRMALFEAFLALTLPYVDAVYTDALCLMGDGEAAADLVVKAYRRAFQEYGRSRGEPIPARLRTRGTLAWLYGNLHAAFCDRVLSRTQRGVMPTGGRP